MNLTLVTETGDFTALKGERTYVDLSDKQIKELQEDPKYWHHEWAETELYIEVRQLLANLADRGDREFFLLEKSGLKPVRPMVLWAQKHAMPSAIISVRSVCT